MGAVRDLWNAGAPWEPVAARNWGEAISDKVDLGTGGLGSINIGLVIVETSLGVWSGDAPPGRVDGEYPIQFWPMNPDNPTDPTDPTHGIDTPANIRDWDMLGPVTIGSL